MALNQELHKMRRDILDVSNALIQELTGIGRDRLSLYFSGTSQLRNTEILRIEEVFKDLERVVSAAAPFPVSFKNASLIKELVERAKAGEFDGGKK